jgi:hypothetical protein
MTVNVCTQIRLLHRARSDENGSTVDSVHVTQIVDAVRRGEFQHSYTETIGCEAIREDGCQIFTQDEMMGQIKLAQLRPPRTFDQSTQLADDETTTETKLRVSCPHRILHNFKITARKFLAWTYNHVMLCSACICTHTQDTKLFSSTEVTDKSAPRKPGACWSHAHRTGVQPAPRHPSSQCPPAQSMQHVG